MFKGETANYNVWRWPVLRAKSWPLLKRLTRGSEFLLPKSPSKAINEEYNRLALSRLLQAQTNVPKKL